MGNAFHRKRLPGSRFPKTNGTGIRYSISMPPAARELTAEDVAAKEAERQQQAALEEGRRLRDWNITVLIGIAERALKSWKDLADRVDKRLQEFSGWTSTEFCSLPVDREAADSYEDEFFDYATFHWGRPLSLADRDRIVQHAFTRAIPTAQTIVDATAAVRHVAAKCCDHEEVEVDRFIDMLGRRAARARQDKNDVDSALTYVVRQVSPLLDKILVRP